MGGLKKFVSFLFLIHLMAFPLLGKQFSDCSIQSLTDHEYNKKIFKELIDSKKEKGKALCKEISNLGKELLQKGFRLEAYQMPTYGTSLTYNCFTLWEGKEKTPLTFFVFVWPSKEYALTFSQHNDLYKTTIHSHPYPCAFTVLKGSMVQETFTLTKDKRAKFKESILLGLFDQEVDDLSNCFIHRLYGYGTGSLPCITLHAYGASSEEEALRQLQETVSANTYEECS